MIGLKIYGNLVQGISFQNEPAALLTVSPVTYSVIEVLLKVNFKYHPSLVTPVLCSTECIITPNSASFSKRITGMIGSMFLDLNPNWKVSVKLTLAPCDIIRVNM